MTDQACLNPAHHAPRFATRSIPGPAGIVARLLALLALRRERRALAALEAYRLADLGLTEELARTEAARPLWDAPSHWRR